jgi:hypothetical protein
MLLPTSPRANARMAGAAFASMAAAHPADHDDDDDEGDESDDAARASGGGGRMSGGALADVSAVNTRGNTHTSPVCDVCFRVCHISMVVVLGSGDAEALAQPESQRTRCAYCILDDASLGKQSLGWASGARGSERLLLVCRYSLDELDDLIASARKRMLAGSDAGAHLAGSNR